MINGGTNNVLELALYRSFDYFGATESAGARGEAKPCTYGCHRLAEVSETKEYVLGSSVMPSSKSTYVSYRQFLGKINIIHHHMCFGDVQTEGATLGEANTSSCHLI